MAARRKSWNPFYALVVLTGAGFTVTATAYGIMAYRDTQPHATSEGKLGSSPVPPAGNSANALMSYLNKNGSQLLGAELAVLALASLAAMGTDRLWERFR